MEQNKKITSVFIDTQILEHIKFNSKIKNLSEWINLKYPDEFMSVNLKKEEENLIKLNMEIKKCKKRIEIIKKLEDQIKLPVLAEKWIKNEGPKRYKKCLDGLISFEAVLKFFNNNFNLNLNQRQFKILLEKK